MTHDHDRDPETDGETPPPEDVEAAEGQLREAGQPFVRATVVRREAPISASVGDRAIVTEEGIVAGWIGGVGCAQTAVERESKRVLETGEPILVGLAPDPETIDRAGLEAFPLTCHSGGTIEVFLEPAMTAPRLLVVGGSAIGEAVAAGANDLGYRVTVLDPVDGDHPYANQVLATTDYREVVDALGGAEAVVVASVGELDGRGVAAAIELDAGYVGLVASRSRADEVTERAADLLGVDAESVRERVRSPAGIEIGAERPAEIGVSILAELVQERDGLDAATGTSEVTRGEQSDAEGLETVTDPVCGMQVDPSTAVASVDHGDVRYYFCGEGCADAFREHPGEYLETA